MKETTKHILDRYSNTHVFIHLMQECILEAANEIIACYKNGGKLLICGNGGSNADADHIAGELIKGFVKQRRIDKKIAEKIENFGAREMIDKLQGSLPVINLGAHTSLITAVANDIGAEMIFAQQVMGYGKKGDLLIGITTSGNSEDVIYAGIVARAKEMHTILLTGGDGGKAKGVFEVSLAVPETTTADIQDMHSVIYHALCMMIENEFWEI